MAAARVVRPLGVSLLVQFLAGSLDFVCTGATQQPVYEIYVKGGHFDGAAPEVPSKRKLREQTGTQAVEPKVAEKRFEDSDKPEVAKTDVNTTVVRKVEEAKAVPHEIKVERKSKSKVLSKDIVEQHNVTNVPSSKVRGAEHDSKKAGHTKVVKAPRKKKLRHAEFDDEAEVEAEEDKIEAEDKAKENRVAKNGAKRIAKTKVSSGAHDAMEPEKGKQIRVVKRSVKEAAKTKVARKVSHPEPSGVAKAEPKAAQSVDVEQSAEAEVSTNVTKDEPQQRPGINANSNTRKANQKVMEVAKKLWGAEQQKQNEKTRSPGAKVASPAAQDRQLKAGAIFERYDLDRNGTLNKQELKSYLSDQERNWALVQLRSKSEGGVHAEPAGFLEH